MQDTLKCPESDRTTNIPMLGLGAAIIIVVIALWWRGMIIINRHHFTDRIGFPPPSSVSRIRYADEGGWTGRDAAYWLRFRYADSAVIDAIISAKNLKKREKCDGRHSYIHPRWWNIPRRDGLGGDEIHLRLKSFYSNDVELCYDAKAKMVYYYEAYW